MLVKPQVSVVIGSFNRYGFLKGIVNNIRKELKSLSYEMIVVDGGSTDGSVEWLNQQKDVITILQHNRGIWQDKPIERRSWGYFTNLAFKAAQGKYILMLSDDCLLVPNAVQNGVKVFEDLLKSGRKIGGVAFYWREWPDKKDYWVTLVLENRMMINHGLFLRSAAEEVGWIEEDAYDFYHADSDFALKLWHKGYEIVDSPHSFVEHYEHLGTNIRRENVQRASEDWQTLLRRWSGIFYHASTPTDPSFQYKTYDDPYKTADQFKSLAEDKPTITVANSEPTNALLIPMPEADLGTLSNTEQLANTFRAWNALRIRQDVTSQRSPILSRIAPLGFVYRILARVRKLGQVWGAQADFYVDVVREIEGHKRYLANYPARFNQYSAALQSASTTIQELRQRDVENSRVLGELQATILELSQNLTEAIDRTARFEEQQRAQLSQLEQLQQQARVNTSYIRLLKQNRQLPSDQPNAYEHFLLPSLLELEAQFPELKTAQSADFSIQDGQATTIVNALAAYFDNRLQVMVPEVWYHIDYQSAGQIDAQVHINAVSKVRDNGWFVLICKQNITVPDALPRLKLLHEMPLKASDSALKAYIWRKLPVQSQS